MSGVELLVGPDARERDQDPLLRGRHSPPVARCAHFEAAIIVPHFPFHDLRHFAVSQLIAQGANILELARVAGHADPSITLRVYSHLMEGALGRAADRYDPLRALAADGS